MRPFVMTMTAQKRITRREIDAIERLALDVFEAVYDGQRSRIANAIQRAAPETIAEFEAAIGSQWREEPGLVEVSARQWYDETAARVGLETIDTYGMGLEWGDVNDAMLDMSGARAGWFSRAMTETSMRQTQDTIRTWLQTEGATIGELTEQMNSIWTGPRPAAAAVTETTNIVAQSQAVTIQESGWWGYNVHTMNDSLVRHTHRETAQNGPYPISDTDHMPPINGDVNCRCFISPEMEAPV